VLHDRVPTDVVVEVVVDDVTMVNVRDFDVAAYFDVAPRVNVSLHVPDAFVVTRVDEREHAPVAFHFFVPVELVVTNVVNAVDVDARNDDVFHVTVGVVLAAWATLATIVDGATPRPAATRILAVRVSLMVPLVPVAEPVVGLTGLSSPPLDTALVRAS